jgi:lipoprotein NlpI
LSIRLAGAAILLTLGLAGSALATDQTGAFDCGALHDPLGLVVKDYDGATAACTHIIQGLGTPRERAVASINRGALHLAKAIVGGTDYGPESAAAVEDFSEAVNLDPKFAFARYARGVGRTWGFREDPMPDFDAAIRLDPNFAYAFQGRGSALALSGDPNRAIAEYTAAIRLDPTLGYSFAGRGAARHENGDDDGAIADLTEALRLTTDDPYYRFWAVEVRGTALLGKDDLDRAVADFTEVLRLKPNYAYAYLYRGIAELLRGSFDPARADMQRAAELGPANADFAVWREIADRRSHSQGRLGEAAKKLDMSVWPGAMVQMLLGEPTSKTLLEAASDEPAAKELETCQAHVFAGELALLKTAKAEAVDAFKTAVATCPAKYFERSVAAAELNVISAKP